MPRQGGDHVKKKVSVGQDQWHRKKDEQTMKWSLFGKGKQQAKKGKRRKSPAEDNKEEYLVRKLVGKRMRGGR